MRLQGLDPCIIGDCMCHTFSALCTSKNPAGPVVWGKPTQEGHLGASCDFRILESEKASPVLLIWAREAMVGCGVVVCAQATHLQWDQDT